MEELSVGRLFALSKQARSAKDYKLEKNYLEQALSLNPTNTKLINAFIRNLRKEGNTVELKKWLNTLYQLTPNGKILFELRKLEEQEGNTEKVLEILLENEKISPNSKKIKKRISKITMRENVRIIRAFFSLTEEQSTVIGEAREMIYREDEFSNKYSQIAVLLANESEEVILSVMAELYAMEATSTTAQGIVKKYKRSLDSTLDVEKIKFANKLLELILNKKTKRFHWDDFWRNNATIVSSEIGNVKVFIKRNLESK